MLTLPVDLAEWQLAVWIDGFQVPVPWHQQVHDILLLERLFRTVAVCDVCVVYFDLEVQWSAVYTTAVNDIDEVLESPQCPVAPSLHEDRVQRVFG